MLQHQKPLFVLSISAFVLAFFNGHCSATQFIVGGSSGWVIPPVPDYYLNWSRSQLIRTGDTLEFNFDTRYYNLIQVSESEYWHCTSMEPLRVFNSSPAIISLKQRGPLYFTCSISNYCVLGQKIMIFVHDPPIIPPPQSQVAPKISPQLQPPPQNGSGMGKPPAPSRSNIPPKLAPGPGGNNGGNSPIPSPSQGGNSNDAVGLVFETSFNVFLGMLLSVFGNLLLGLFN